MSLADPVQNFQDWFTQQWAILWGKKIDPKTVPWLMGPFGRPGLKSDDLINQLAESEGLTIRRNVTSQGLISSIRKLNLPALECAHISSDVANFYEHTSNYNLKFSVKWNPLFKLFGQLVNCLFSNRIGQLNIPTNNSESSKQVKSEIITLADLNSGEVKYTFWYRTFEQTGEVIYSGIYSTCILPSGITCIKAVFPLPNGNATVIMSPGVGHNGELRLNSAGKKFGDPGFYFLLNDSKGTFWSQYIRSFRDQLIVRPHDGDIAAEQTLTLWHKHVLQISYEIQLKKNDK